MPSIHSSASTASATQSIDGVLIVSPAKMPSISLPPLVMRKIFGSGRRRHEALQPLHGAGREDQDPMAALAAHGLLPGEGGHIELVPRQVLREGRRGGVAEGQPLAVGGDPVAVRHPRAGGGAVPGEADVRVPAHRAQGREARRSPRSAPGNPRASAAWSRRSPSLGRSSPRPACRPARAPSIDHMAISKAPVSDAGTMPTR